MEGSVERVGIAVAPKTHAQLLLDWSLQHGLIRPGSGNEELFMVYVRSRLRRVPTPVGKVPISHVSPEKLQEYVATREASTTRFRQDLERLCDERQVKGMFVVVESDHVGKTIVEQIRTYDLTKFVLGASRHGLKLKLGISDYVLRHGPKRCQVQCVSKSARLLAATWMPSTPPHNMTCFSPTAPTQTIQPCISNVSVDSHPGLETFVQISRIEVNDELEFESPRLSTITLEVEELVEEIISSPVSSELSSPENNLEVEEEVTILKRQLQGAISAAERAKEIARKEIARALDACEWTVKKAEIMRAEEQRKRQAAVMAAEMANKRLEEESQKHAETVLLAESMKKALDQEIERRQMNEQTSGARMKAGSYREFTVEELHAMTDNFSHGNKLGEGSYYRGTFLHIDVAVKVPKAGSRQEQIEALSGLNHPHIALLIGGNSNQGHLVYEYLENGSLRDHLLHGSNTSPIPHYKRYVIAVQVAAAVLFLHKASLVHGRLKASNIILDTNLNSKITDVTLPATSIPAQSEAEELAYLDPECWEDGGEYIVDDVKCDVYAFGVILLQLITGGSPVDIVDRVSYAADKGCLKEIVDCTAGEWPLEHALQLACIGLSCTEHHRENRPELETVLQMLKEMLNSYSSTCKEEAEGRSEQAESSDRPPAIFLCPILQEIMEYPVLAADGYTYEFEAIRRWLDRKETSPMTNLPLEHKTLTANRLVRSAICEWRLMRSSTTTTSTKNYPTIGRHLDAAAA